MKSRNTVGSKLASALALALIATAVLSTAAEAARPSQKQLLTACRQKYGKDITSATMQKNGRIVCQEGPGPEATRKEVFEWCKKKFSATTLIVSRKGDKWHCLYYGRY